MDWGRRKAGEAGLTKGERGASRMEGTLSDVAKRKNKDKRIPIGFGNKGATWDPRRDLSRLSWSRNPVNLISCKVFLF